MRGALNWICGRRWSGGSHDIEAVLGATGMTGRNVVDQVLAEWWMNEDLGSVFEIYSCTPRKDDLPNGNKESPNDDRD